MAVDTTTVAVLDDTYGAGIAITSISGNNCPASISPLYCHHYNDPTCFFLHLVPVLVRASVQIKLAMLDFSNVDWFFLLGCFVARWVLWHNDSLLAALHIA